jgi:hypothetical protein
LSVRYYMRLLCGTGPSRHGRQSGVWEYTHTVISTQTCQRIESHFYFIYQVVGIPCKNKNDELKRRSIGKCF